MPTEMTFPLSFCVMSYEFVNIFYCAHNIFSTGRMVGVPTLLGKMNASMERLITQHVCSLWDCSSISRSVLVHEIQLLGKCGKAAPDFETTAVSSQHSHLVADYTYSTFFTNTTTNSLSSSTKQRPRAQASFLKDAAHHDVAQRSANTMYAMYHTTGVC